LSSRTSILLIKSTTLPSAAIEFSIEWTPPLDVGVVEDLSVNPSHCMVFSAISSKNFLASSFVVIMKSFVTHDSSRVLD